MASKNLEIVQVVSSLGFGGTQKAAQLVSEGLSEEHSVSVLSLEDGVRRDPLENKGIEVIIGDRNEVVEIIEDKSPDVVHFQGDWCSKSFLESIRGCSGLICKTTNFGWVDPELVGYFDYVFFPSKMVLYRFSLIRSELYEKSPEKFRLLYNPLNDGRGDGKITGFEELPSNETIIGKIGRPAEGKWSDITIDAFNEINDKGYHLLLVSPPQSIQDKIRDLGIEEFVTVVEEIPLGEIHRFYNSIDVLAHSSDIGESFGYVLAESLSQGTPVVVNSTPMRDNAQVELVKNGKDGFIANSTEAYSESLKKAANTELKPELIEEIKAQNVCFRLQKLYSGENTDRVKLEQFTGDYNQMLVDIEGPIPLSYNFEIAAWNIACSFPLFRAKVYDILRGFFQPDRKLYKLVGNLID